VNEYDRALADYDAAIQLWPRVAKQFENTVSWKSSLDRFTLERGVISDVSKSTMPAVRPEMLCTEFPTFRTHKRERSPLLSPSESNRLPELNILPADRPAT